MNVVAKGYGRKVKGISHTSAQDIEMYTIKTSVSFGLWCWQPGTLLSAVRTATRNKETRLLVLGPGEQKPSTRRTFLIVVRRCFHRIHVQNDGFCTGSQFYFCSDLNRVCWISFALKISLFWSFRSEIYSAISFVLKLLKFCAEEIKQGMSSCSFGRFLSKSSYVVWSEKKLK